MGALSREAAGLLSFWPICQDLHPATDRWWCPRTLPKGNNTVSGGGKRIRAYQESVSEESVRDRPSDISHKMSSTAFFLPQKYFKTRGVIGRRKTPWTGDTTNQALVA